MFDKEGVALVPVDEDGQAKPAVLGVRWVNPDTFETIRVRGGKRTGPKSEVLMEVPPTLDTSPFAIEDLPPPKVKQELAEIEKPLKHIEPLTHPEKSQIQKSSDKP